MSTSSLTSTLQLVPPRGLACTVLAHNPIKTHGHLSVSSGNPDHDVSITGPLIKWIAMPANRNHGSVLYIHHVHMHLF